jgi:hypothetical protein
MTNCLFYTFWPRDKLFILHFLAMWQIVYSTLSGQMINCLFYTFWPRDKLFMLHFLAMSVTNCLFYTFWPRQWQIVYSTHFFPGKLRLNKSYKNRKNKLNLGSFFGRHHGFDQLSQDESDHELDHLSDSEVEEYTASTQKAWWEELLFIWWRDLP